MQLMKLFFSGIFILAIFTGAFLISTAITMFFWNTLAAYFGFKPITLWIAVIMNIALMILVGWLKPTKKQYGRN